MNEAAEDCEFEKQYVDARGRVDYFTIAHVLSARLRQMDKRAKAANTRADKAVADLAALERMRPHWARGYSSDGVAAQVTCVALNELWELLGVSNQTDAVAKLKALKGGAAT